MKFRHVLVTLAAIVVPNAGFAADGYKYQVGMSDGIKMWTVDFDSKNSNSLAEAVWQWESQNLKQALILCKREWSETARQGNANYISTTRYSCRVFEKEK